MLNWQDYASKVIRAKFEEGIILPTVTDLVVDELSKSKDPMKREDLVNAVSAITGISKDEVSSGIGSILDKLQSKGIVSNVSYGYWAIAQK